MNDSLNADNRAIRSGTLNFNRRLGLVLLLAACCIGFLIANVAMSYSFGGPFTTMLCVGVVTAQVTVICVWGALVRGTFLVRLPWTLLLLTLSWCGLALGINMEAGRANVDAMLQLAWIWLLVFVTTFVPLKIVDLCFGWQIIQDSVDAGRQRRDSKYSIKDLMVGTLLLAVSLGLVRIMLPDEGVSIIRAIQESLLFDGYTFMVISIFGVVSLLVKLPCIWIALGKKREKIPLKIIIWVFYCCALAIVEIMIFYALFGSLGNDSFKLYSGIILGHQAMGAIVLSVCFALRGLGYRVERAIGGRVLHDTEHAIETVPFISEPGAT